VIADQVLRPAGEVSELGARNIDSKALIKGGKDVAEMNGPATRLLAPAIRRTEDLAMSHAATGQ